MQSTKFSLISLVYNTKEEYLRYALDSLLNQNYDNFEVIIIDDGSNEETKNILNDYKETCIIKHQANKGMPASRLEGLKLVTGDYVIFVDSDDYINPDTLKIYNSIIQEYNVDIVMQDFVKFTGNIDNIIKHNEFFNEGLVSKEEVIKQLCLLHANGTCGRAVKTDLFKGMENHIDTSFQVGEDVQQSTYVLLNANSFYYTREKIYFYRIVEEHRSYYSIKNLRDCDFLSPVYKMVFKDNDNYKYLPLFKNSAQNSITYNAFRICLFSENKNERVNLLNSLNKLEIVSIINSISCKASFVSSFLYTLFIKKHYTLLCVMSKLYDLIYGMQKL